MSKTLSYRDIWGVRIFSKDGKSDFLASGHDGVFNTFHRKKAEQFKRDLREHLTTGKLKVVPLTIREVFQVTRK